MCVQYWPAGKNREEVYSGVGVTVENEEQLANFMIRTIRLRKVITHNDATTLGLMTFRIMTICIHEHNCDNQH